MDLLVTKESAKLKKLFLGIGSFIPIICLVVVFFTNGVDVPYHNKIFNAAWTTGMLTWAAMVVFYLIRLYVTKNGTSETRVLWLFVLLAGFFFSLPFYWYFRIWHEPHLRQRDLRPVPSQSMAKPTKKLLGIASFVNLIFLFLALEISTGIEIGALPGILVIFAYILVVPSLAFIIYYSVHAWREPMSKPNIIAWVLLLSVHFYISIPIYWYLHIWREPKIQQIAQ